MGKNNKYLIACDLDGTLLNNDSDISEKTIEGIKKSSIKAIFSVL